MVSVIVGALALFAFALALALAPAVIQIMAQALALAIALVLAVKSMCKGDPNDGPTCLSIYALTSLALAHALATAPALATHVLAFVIALVVVLRQSAALTRIDFLCNRCGGGGKQGCCGVSSRG